MKRPSRKALKITRTFEMDREGPSAVPQRNLEATDPSVFDNLSKTLDDHAQKLSEDDAKIEGDLRPKVVDALKNFANDQSTVGRVLSEYKIVYKTQRQWTSVAKRIGETISCSARTIYRMVEQYEASPTPVVGACKNIDRGDIDGDELSKQERRGRDARLAIRAFLNNSPNSEKREVLASLLAEEAYQIWGITEPFSIEVRPQASAFTIDGRKKLPMDQAREKAA
jgi:hypothetical protein